MPPSSCAPKFCTLNVCQISDPAFNMIHSYLCSSFLLGDSMSPPGSVTNAAEMIKQRKERKLTGEVRSGKRSIRHRGYPTPPPAKIRPKSADIYPHLHGLSKMSCAYFADEIESGTKFTADSIFGFKECLKSSSKSEWSENNLLSTVLSRSHFC